MSAGFSFSNDTKAKMPRLAFSRMKAAVLGAEYELSVAVIGPARMRALNKRWRRKDRPTDILSFPLSRAAGEIYLCPSEAKKEALKFGRSCDNFLGFLFIHGLVHLKGCDHGPIMEGIEAKFRRKFKV
jgi:probable rRNA maturation factor